MKCFQVIVIGAVLTALSGCGVYTFTPKGKSDIKSVSVERFENQTAEYGLEDRMTDHSLERIGKFFNKPVYEMSDAELQEAAFKMFTILEKDYEDMLTKHNISHEKDEFPMHQHWIDTQILPGVLKAKGKPVELQSLVDRICKTDFGLGYFHNMFAGNFRWASEKNEFRPHTLGNYQIEFRRAYAKQKEDLDNHLKFIEEMKGKITAQPPNLLAEKTLDLPVIPYAIAFLENGNLVVMGIRADADEKDHDSTIMLLNIYDVEKKKMVKSASTGIHSAFSGFACIAAEFLGSLTIGSDGIICVNGGGKRFDSRLNDVSDLQDSFTSARRQVLELNSDLRVFDVLESEGIFYFALEPRWDPRCYNNVLIASDGKKIIGTPVSYSPNGGGQVTSWDGKPRMAIFGNLLYFKNDHNILSVDKSLSEESMKKAFKIIDSETLEHGCVPSKHCISPKGVLYAVTGLEGEIAQSIKGYVPGKERGEVLNYFYPENYPGGWAAIRSMSISKEGLLAYSDVHENKIHFYQLND